MTRTRGVHPTPGCLATTRSFHSPRSTKRPGQDQPPPLTTTPRRPPHPPGGSVVERMPTHPWLGGTREGPTMYLLYIENK